MPPSNLRNAKPRNEKTARAELIGSSGDTRPTPAADLGCGQAEVEARPSLTALADTQGAPLESFAEAATPAPKSLAQILAEMEAEHEATKDNCVYMVLNPNPTPVEAFVGVKRTFANEKAKRAAQLADQIALSDAQTAHREDPESTGVKHIQDAYLYEAGSIKTFRIMPGVTELPVFVIEPFLLTDMRPAKAFIATAKQTPSDLMPFAFSYRQCDEAPFEYRELRQALAAIRSCYSKRTLDAWAKHYPHNASPDSLLDADRISCAISTQLKAQKLIFGTEAETLTAAGRAASKTGIGRNLDVTLW